MKARREQQSPPEDIVRFRKELGLKLDRLMAESLEAWPTCENTRCRRAKRCASPNRECIRKWRESLPPVSPEEAKQRLADLNRELELRSGGLPLVPAAVKKPLSSKAVATTPNDSSQGNDDDKTPMPAAHEPPLSAEKAERIDRIWNDTVASLPAEEPEAEDAGTTKRAPGPRITLL